MRDHIHKYDTSIFGAYGKLDHLEKAIASIQNDYIAGLKCSLDSVKNQVTVIATQVASLATSQTQIKKDIKDLQQGEEEDKHYHNNEKESKKMARKRKLDANFITEEEEAADHTMVLCDLTDCKYCIEKNKKECLLTSIIPDYC